MKHYLSILHSLIIATFLVSCSNDNMGLEPDLGGDVTMTLSLDLPGGFAPATSRSLTLLEENKIEDLTVLVFDRDNKLADIKQGRHISDATWGVTVGQSPAADATGSYTFNLVVIANAQRLITDGRLDFTSFLYVDPALGKTEDEVREKVLRYLDAKMYAGVESKSIPMWGETGQHTIDRRNPNRRVKLLRSLARIDVGVGTPVGSATAGFSWTGLLLDGEKFDLQQVYVMRPNQYISVLSSRLNVTNNAATAVTLPPTPNDGQWDIPTSLATFAYNVTGGYTTQEIYVPESNVKRGSITSGGAEHENRMALVVAGSYMGAPTSYYRLDFAYQNTLMDVLRNHIYQFSIKKVLGPGYETPEEAYKSLALNLEADVVEWNTPTIGDIVFDGQYHFGIESREVVLPARGEVRSLALVTNHPTWSVSGGGLFSYSPINGTLTTNALTITAGENTGLMRSETVTISAGRNRITVKVTQMGRHSITFDSQGGSGVGDIIVGGGALATTIVWPPAPTLSGKKFNGWWTTDAGSGTRVDGNPQWSMPDQNVMLYARWVDDGKPTVIFDFQGGFGGTISITGIPGSSMPLATAPQHAFDVFLGYFSATNGGGTQYYDANMTSLRNWDFASLTNTLYAHWQRRYQLTYWDGYGDKIGSPTKHNPNTQIGAPVDPQREGHTFKAWSKAHPFTITDHTDVTALWNLKTLTATFTYGLTYFETAEVLYGQPWVAPHDSPTREYYNFAGWVDRFNFQQVGSPATADANFEASWDGVPFTMTYILNGGRTPDNSTSRTVKYPNTWGTPPVVSKNGYTMSPGALFGPWTISNNQVFGLSATKDCTATVQWVPSEITFVNMQNNVPNTEMAGDPVRVPFPITQMLIIPRLRISETTNYYNQTVIVSIRNEHRETQSARVTPGAGLRLTIGGNIFVTITPAT